MNKCLVIGGCNIDIIAKSNQPLIKQNSNIGTVSITFGGVSRNIGENMALLGEHIYYSTVFSDDYFGKILYQKCLDDHFNLNYSKIVSNYNTSTYLAVLNQDNDMDIGINDMEIINALVVSDLKKILCDFDEDDFVIVDTNLSIECLTYILEHKHYHVALDPISIDKVGKINNLVQYIDIFKPNLYEAIELTGLDDPLTSIKKLVDLGIKEVCLTLNKDGVLYYNNGVYKRQFINQDIIINNATGAGDCFLAVYVTYRKRGYAIDEAITLSMVASALKLGCATSVNGLMNDDYLKEHIKDYNIEMEEIC